MLFVFVFLGFFFAGGVEFGPHRLSLSISLENVQRYENNNLPYLHCSASNIMPNSSIVWSKDGIFFKSVKIPNGFSARIYPWTISQTPWENQGYYTCEVWGVAPYARVHLQPGLVRYIGRYKHTCLLMAYFSAVCVHTDITE